MFAELLDAAENFGFPTFLLCSLKNPAICGVQVRRLRVRINVSFYCG